MNSTARLLRITKAVLVTAVGLQAGIIVLGNITDYHSNYAFVEHVLNMDTIFATSRLHDRSLSSPVLVQASYGLIIGLEGLMSGCCLRGGWLLVKHLDSDPMTFQAAKNWAVAGLSIGLLIWYVGFEVVGGEWFAMWQSPTWNGLNSAQRMVSALGLGLLLLHQRDA